jgi:quercetin dioxygenase-like cupin family protein
MICLHKKIEKQNLGKGIVLQVLGIGKNMNVLHWDMDNESEVKTHTHPQEQFGFIIKGQLDLTIEGKETSLKAGDGYFIPEHAEHSFIARGRTEAIDVFSPIKMNYDNPRIDEILKAVLSKR